MIEKRGDFWAELGDIHVITTNGMLTKSGACIMGRGIALQAKKKFPGIDKHLGSLIKPHGNVVHPLGIWYDEIARGYNLYSFPVKCNWWEPANIELIKSSVQILVTSISATKVQRLVTSISVTKVVMVRPGCGTGGLSWDVTVRDIIEPLLDDRFIVMER